MCYEIPRPPLFVHFRSIFPGSAYRNFLIVLLSDGAELLEEKHSWVFDQKDPLDPKSCFFVQSFSLELLIEISDLRICDFR